jgi:hypothetical protein
MRTEDEVSRGGDRGVQMASLSSPRPAVGRIRHGNVMSLACRSGRQEEPQRSCDMTKLRTGHACKHGEDIAAGGETLQGRRPATSGRKVGACSARFFSSTLIFLDVSSSCLSNEHHSALSHLYEGVGGCSENSMIRTNTRIYMIWPFEVTEGLRAHLLIVDMATATDAATALGLLRLRPSLRWRADDT